MIEIKNQENETVKLPNNIRQVGTPGEKIKIYIEDYVMTYLNQITGEKPISQKIALLLGRKIKKENAEVYFVNAAVEVTPVEWKEDQFKLSSDEWTTLYDKVNQYFKDKHTLGWFLSRPGQAATVNGQIEKVHTDNFKDKGSLFYTVDPLDREDAFYLYDNGHLFRQHGYYIYYDRNEEMQNYMIEMRQENGRKEQGTSAFQNRLFEKRTDHQIKKGTAIRKKKSYAWIPQTAVLLLILAVFGVRRYMGREAVTVSRSISESDVTEQRVLPTDSTEHLDIVESIVQQAEKSVSGKQQSQIENETEKSSKNVEENQRTDTESQSITEESKEVAEDEKEVIGNNYDSYVVKEGDTLLKISRHFYQDAIHVEEIRKLNQIEDPDYIYPGMVLRLP